MNFIRMGCGIVAGALTLGGCAMRRSLEVTKQEAHAANVIQNRGNAQGVHSVVVIKPLGSGKKKAAASDDLEPYVNLVENLLLKSGYAVVNREVLIRTKRRLIGRLDPDQLSASELALLYGEESSIDALVKIESVNFSRKAVHHIVFEKSLFKTSDPKEFEDELARTQQRGLDAGDDFCTLEVPILEFAMAVEMISLRNGQIIARGQATASSLQLLPKSYEVSIQFADDGCDKVSENLDLETLNSKELLKPKIDEAIASLFKSTLTLRQGPPQREERWRDDRRRERRSPIRRERRAEPRPEFEETENEEEPSLPLVERRPEPEVSDRPREAPVREETFEPEPRQAHRASDETADELLEDVDDSRERRLINSLKKWQ